MRVIKPVSITDARLAQSNIPEPDASQGEIEWTAGTYVTGTQRINTTTHRVYEVVASPSTSDDPIVGVDLPVPSWVDVGPTNRWAMFDSVNGTQSISSSPLDITLAPNLVTNSLAGFNIVGASDVQVIMTDPTEGEVYNKTIEMVDNSGVVDYYEYYFGEIINRTSFALIDLPSYTFAETQVIFNGVADIAVGTIIAGNQIVLGVANYGTGMQLLDFSIKERDEFGNFKITPRRSSKLVDFDVTIPTNRVSYVFNTLAGLTTVPSVWIGTENGDDSTIVYGYYRDSQINISAPTISECTIQIEGLT